MMPLVKHIAGRPPPVGFGFHRRGIGGVDHHQRMVADDDIGAARPSCRFLDETAIVMRAGAVDALAAAVGKADGLGASRKVCQPGRKGRTRQVAVAGRPGPARHQPQRRAPSRRPAELAERLFKIEKAQIVLAPLADYHLARAAGGVRIEAGELRGDLVLQGTGIGGNPDWRAVGFGPQRRRRQIAERLAGAGSRLGQHHGWQRAGIRPVEPGGKGGGVIRLAFAQF